MVPGQLAVGIWWEARAGVGKVKGSGTPLVRDPSDRTHRLTGGDWYTWGMKRPIVVAAKLAHPKVGRVLNRGRLSGALRYAPEVPLCLIRAGAGYGKSTLMAQAAAEFGHPVAWYRLGPEDADLSVFLWHLVYALKSCRSTYGKSLLALLKETPRPRPQVAGGAFLNDLSLIKKPMSVVLDDYHAVTDSSDINAFMSMVVEHMDTAARFVIASRTEPALPLGRLRARNRMVELDSGDLAFRRGEINALMEEVHDLTLSDESLDTIARRTEGWIAALQLVMALPRRDKDPGGSLRFVTQAGSAVHDYLAEEVLKAQAGADREWILWTSILDEVTVPAVNSLLPGQDAETRIQSLVAKSLLHPFDTHEGERIYRYHSLLKQYLLGRLSAEVAQEERLQLHRNACAYYEERGNLIAAARQMALMNDPGELARFLSARGSKLLDQGHYQILLPWFEELSPEAFETEPKLRVYLGDVRRFLGDWPGAELEYERAQSRFEELGNPSGTALAALGLLRLWNLRGDSARVVRRGEELMSEIDGQDPLFPQLLQILSGAYFYLGRYADALDLLDKLETHLGGDASRQAALWNNRGVVWASQGNYQKAAGAFERGLERPGARRSPRASLHLANLALLFSAMGDTQRAGTLLHEALDLARTYGNKGQVLSCLVGLANHYYQLGSVEKGHEVLREAEELNRELKVPLMEAELLALRAKRLRDGEQFAAARNTLNRALAAYGSMERDANWLNYRIESAVVDLVSGRTREAYSALQDLLPVALELEALFPRTKLLFYLGESKRRLDDASALDDLDRALELGRTNGYDAFFRSSMRSSFDPFASLLEAGRHPETIKALVAAEGTALEGDLLRVLKSGRASRPAVVQALGEIGTAAAYEALSAETWPPELAPGVETALAAILRRHPDIDSAAVEEPGASVSVTALGKLKIAAGEDVVPRKAWRSKRALDMFIYLVLSRRGVSKDRLIELFWPTSSLQAAERNFHPTVTYIRGALKSTQSEVVVVRDGLYELAPGLRVAVDALSFETLVARARAAKNPAEQLALYEQALPLYGGEFLEGRYDSWIDEIRARLAVLRGEALEAMAKLYLDREDYKRALDCLRLLLEENPFQESTHVDMMKCYHYLRDRRAIKQQYQDLTMVLQEELGIEPLPETKQIYEAFMLSP